MISFKNRSRKPRKPKIEHGQRVTLAELDQWLDVKVAAFDSVVSKLAEEFRAKNVSLDIPLGEELALTPVGSRVSWTRLYEAQVRRLASMERAEEFAMARRYEFVKTRAETALRDAGYGDEEVVEILRNGGRDLPTPDQALSAEDHDYLQLVLAELEMLRNRYVEGALYLVLSGAHRYRNLGVDYADLIQEGNASLFNAIDGFDWRRDVRFKTYAQYWIHQAVLKVLYNASRTVRVPIWVQKSLAKIQRVRQQDRKDDGSAPSHEEVGEKLGLPEERVRQLLETKRYAVSLDAEVAGEDGVSLGQLLPDDSSDAVLESIEDGDLGSCLDDVMEDLPSREHMILTRRFGLHGREPETLGQIADDMGITAERVRQLQNAALSRLKKPGKMRRLRAYT